MTWTVERRQRQAGIMRRRWENDPEFRQKQRAGAQRFVREYFNDPSRHALAALTPSERREFDKLRKLGAGPRAERLKAVGRADLLPSRS